MLSQKDFIKYITYLEKKEESLYKMQDILCEYKYEDEYVGIRNVARIGKTYDKYLDMSEDYFNKQTDTIPPPLSKKRGGGWMSEKLPSRFSKQKFKNACSEKNFLSKNRQNTPTSILCIGGR